MQDEETIDETEAGSYEFKDATGVGDPLGIFTPLNPIPVDYSYATYLITKSYLDGLNKDVPHHPKDVAHNIIVLVHRMTAIYNETAPPYGRWSMIYTLPPAVIAQVMLELHTIKNINCSGVNSEKDYDILAIYHDSGPDAGTYVSDEYEINRLILRYNNNLKINDVKEVMRRLKLWAPRVERCSDPDLIAVNNGIFNYKTKVLNDFDPDIVFITKSHVDYNPAAQNVIIHNDDDNTDWDVESWILDVADQDPEVAEMLWQVTGAIVRPNVKWNKAAWFVSEKGNNGKGTLCHLMRNLVGEGTYAAIPLSDFGKKFMLEPLINASCIITDENDVGTFIDKVANLKAIITNDVIQMDRKFKTPIAYQFKGFMVQCVNELPRTKDKSESFYRRQLFIPFKKCFTGKERKYIKDDYLNRQDVLEYVLFKILNTDYYEIKEAESCREALQEYKIYNDPIRDFLREITDRLSWRCVPKSTLFEMYKGWSKINNPNGGTLGRNTFYQDVKNSIGSVTSDWDYSDERFSTGNGMDGGEPLLDEFNCVPTMLNPNLKTGRIRAKKIPDVIRGLRKISGTTNPGGISADADEEDDNEADSTK